jgi:hypothetical protein
MLTVQQYAKGATIPQQYLNNAHLTVSIVNDIFNQFPNQFTFNSGYRTPAHNAAVGGASNSYHLVALAADITPRNGNYNQYKSALQTIVSRYGWELIDERNKDHFHIEPFGKAPLTTNNRPIDVGVIATVNVPWNSGAEPGFVDNLAASLNVSKSTIYAGSGLLAVFLIKRFIDG